MKLWILAATLVCGTTTFASCTVNDDQPIKADIVEYYIPQAPDYNDPIFHRHPTTTTRRCG